MTTTIAIIDDHALLAEVVADGLRNHDYRVGLLPVSDDILQRLPSPAPDVALIDLELGEANVSGADLIVPLTAMGTMVIILTGNEDRIVWARCLELGAAGILSKKRSFSELVAEIDSSISAGTIAPGDSLRVALLRELAEHRRSSATDLDPFEQLTVREVEILKALMAGRSVGEISEAEFVSVATVRTQVKSILRKLGVGSQLQAVAMAYQAGWPHVEASGAPEARLRSAPSAPESRGSGQAASNRQFA